MKGKDAPTLFCVLYVNNMLRFRDYISKVTCTTINHPLSSLILVVSSESSDWGGGFRKLE